MSLTDLARQVIAPRVVRPASQGGAQSGRLAEYVSKRLRGRDPGGYADSTIATVVWQILRSTEAYQLLLKRLGATSAIWRLGDFVVTPLMAGNVPRFVLVALDPTLTNKPPEAAELEFLPADLNRAFNRWASRMVGQGDYGRDLVEATSPEIVIEFVRTQGLHLALGALPLEFEYTAERPTPPFDIEDAAGSIDFSMGVYSDSHTHGPGVTTAAHGITAGASYELFDGGSLIDSVHGVVLNSVLDSAFLQISKTPAVIPSPAGKTILSGVAPNIMLRHDFYGAHSGLTPATVSGWVDDLLTIEPWLQNRVFTQRILRHRDSGAALIDSSDQTIGFAFYNSSAFKTPTCSAWIWADSVRQDLQLM